MRGVTRALQGIQRTALGRSESARPFQAASKIPPIRSTMPCVAPRTPSAAAVRNSAAPVRPFGPVGAPTHLLRPAESGQKSQERPPQATPKLEEFDPIQVALLKEECIVIDENDKAIGTGSKKDCHLMTNIRDGLLHRAFSVFLFNTEGDLLIQQRSDAKITFPAMYTNSCCSHPLAVPTENTENPIEGVRVAARRRMFAELGIPPEELPLDCFQYLTRIHYQAASGDGVWGEHEIDYILFVQKDIKVMQPCPNEIKSHLWLKREKVPEFLAERQAKGEELTPWFKLILNSLLMEWWENLNDLKRFEDHDRIHKLK